MWPFKRNKPPRREPIAIRPANSVYPATTWKESRILTSEPQNHVPIELDSIQSLNDFDDEDWYYDDEDEGDGIQPPSFSPILLDLCNLPSDGRLGVVGESYYQQALAIAAQNQVAGNDFESHIPVVAALVPEPENKWDEYAVRVDVVLGKQSLKVGHLSRSVAREYQRRFLELQNSGLLGTCPARITGGGDKYYGIYLHLVWPSDYGFATGEEDQEIAEQDAETALLRAHWGCTVTKEEDHQETLLRYAPEDGQENREIRASLDYCKITSGKYKGQDAIEVRIGKERVGQLTPAMTNRYSDLIDRIMNQGLVPTCEAYTKMTHRGVEVELLMPPDPSKLRPITAIKKLKL